MSNIVLLRIIRLPLLCLSGLYLGDVISGFVNNVPSREMLLPLVFTPWSIALLIHIQKDIEKGNKNESVS